MWTRWDVEYEDSNGEFGEWLRLADERDWTRIIEYEQYKIRRAN